MSLDQPTPAAPAAPAAPEAQPAVDKIAALRALFLGRLAKTYPLRLILNDELRAEQAELAEQLAKLEGVRDEMARQGDLPPVKAHSLADATPDRPVADIDRLIQSAREALDSIEAEAEASGEVVVLNFRIIPVRRTPGWDTDYETERKAALEATDGDPSRATSLLAERLMELGYAGATTVDGVDLDVTLDQLFQSALSHGDHLAIAQHCLGINGEAVVADFHRASSGGRATS